eukprot:3167221-Lingulodinium_polyedra.AAC.1
MAMQCPKTCVSAVSLSKTRIKWPCLARVFESPALLRAGWPNVCVLQHFYAPAGRIGVLQHFYAPAGQMRAVESTSMRRPAECA